MSTSVTVACGAGFAGDRIEPAVDLASSNEIDAVVLECLAERTMVAGLLARAHQPGTGYDPRLQRRLSPLLPILAGRRCVVITNMGSANPRAAAAETARLAREMGLEGLRIAAVVGDDVADKEALVAWQNPSIPDAGGQWLGVHAYLGFQPIVEALWQGADVVITGRTADSALFAAPVVAALGSDAPVLATALTIGHLLECGGQLTGGNLADGRSPGLTGADYAGLGYPWARVNNDGTAEVGVLDGKPARLDPLTCTLQLLYEVHDPSAYITPDAILDLTGVRFQQIGPNRTLVTGFSASARPDQLKAVGFRRSPGCIADVEISYVGHGCHERARVAAETMELRLGMLPGVLEHRFDLVGVNSVLGIGEDHDDTSAEVRLHVGAKCSGDMHAQSVEDEVYALTLSGPAGGCAIRSERRPLISVESGLIGRDSITTSLHWFTS